MRTEKSPQQAQSLPVQGWALEPQPQTTLNKYQVSIDNHLLLLQLTYLSNQRDFISQIYVGVSSRCQVCVLVLFTELLFVFSLLSRCYDVLRENCYILSRTRMFSLSRMEIQFTINLIYFYFSSSPLIYFYLTLLSVSVIVCIIVQFYFQVGPFHNK